MTKAGNFAVKFGGDEIIGRWLHEQ